MRRGSTATSRDFSRPAATSAACPHYLGRRLRRISSAVRGIAESVARRDGPHTGTRRQRVHDADTETHHEPGATGSEQQHVVSVRHAADTFAFATALERHLDGVRRACLHLLVVAISRLPANRHWPVTPSSDRRSGSLPAGPSLDTDTTFRLPLPLSRRRRYRACTARARDMSFGRRSRYVVAGTHAP